MENESERESVGLQCAGWLAGWRSLDLVGSCVLIGGKISLCARCQRRICESKTNPGAGTLMHDFPGVHYLGYPSTWVPTSHSRKNPLRELSEAPRLAVGQSASVPSRGIWSKCRLR